VWPDKVTAIGVGAASTKGTDVNQIFTFPPAAPSSVGILPTVPGVVEMSIVELDIDILGVSVADIYTIAVAIWRTQYDKTANKFEPEKFDLLDPAEMSRDKIWFRPPNIRTLSLPARTAYTVPVALAHRFRFPITVYEGMGLNWGITVNSQLLAGYSLTYSWRSRAKLVRFA